MTDQTILLTGANGFIARHIAVRLLDAGYHVRASLRDAAKGAALRDVLRPHLADPAAAERLVFVSLDLTRDDGWAAALAGVDVLVHTASPFPLAPPKDAAEVIRPAVDGTLRALKAAKAAGVQRVVLTSSIAAVMRGAAPVGRMRDERDWTDPEDRSVSAYEASKTLAERAAWDFVEGEGAGIALTTILPGFVLGPPIGRSEGASMQVIARLMAGKDPMQPQVGFPVVDVRDVAEAHLRAVQRGETAGQRFIIADRFLWFREMALILKAAYPGRRIATRAAPNLLIRALGLFDPAVRTILPTLGVRVDLSNAAARGGLGLTFRPADDAVRAAAAAVGAR